MTPTTITERDMAQRLETALALLLASLAENRMATPHHDLYQILSTAHRLVAARAQ